MFHLKYLTYYSVAALLVHAESIIYLGFWHFKINKNRKENQKMKVDLKFMNNKKEHRSKEKSCHT